MCRLLSPTLVHNPTCSTDLSRVAVGQANIKGVLQNLVHNPASQADLFRTTVGQLNNEGVLQNLAPNPASRADLFLTTVGQIDSERMLPTLVHYPTSKADLLWNRVGQSVAEEVSGQWRHIGSNLEAMKGKTRTVLGQQKDKAIMGEEGNAEVVDETMWSTLGEELQENVLARLPLLKLFQVPVLSKDWNWTFQSKRFRDEVTSVSSRWGFYCPLHLSRKGLVGYDSATQRWQKLFTLSYLPYVPQGQDVVSLCSSAGSLICFARKNKTKEREMFRQRQRTAQMPPNLPHDFRRRLQQFCMAPVVDDELSQEAREVYSYIDAMLSGPHNLGVSAFDMYVTNVLTRQWKELPARPYMHRPHIVQLVPVGSGAYKVILITLLQQRSLVYNEGPLCVQVYDSTTGSWTSRNSTAPIFSLEINRSQACKFVYLDQEGVFYIVVQGVGGNSTGYAVMAYNVGQDCWTKVRRPRTCSSQDFIFCELVTCGSDVMLVTRPHPDVHRGYPREETVVVYRLDFDSVVFLEVSRGPRDLEDISNVDLVTGGGECVYFGLRIQPEKPIVVFNIRRRAWSLLSPAITCPRFSDYLFNVRWTRASFQPGLNPFVDL